MAHLLHLRVDEAPSQGGVVHRGVAGGEGALRLGDGQGARLIDSTPPPMYTSASPSITARAAWATASRPEPHRRLTVTPATSSGKPANSSDILATLRLSSPAWFAHPK